MFSVIIPLYNKASYVEKAVRSVLNQSCQEFELIIVNDGSTDNSLEVVKAMQMEDVDVQIIDQINSGVSTTRNNGVLHSKHPYICFLDADDWWKTTFLEEMKVLIRTFPEAGIYGSSYFIVRNQQSRVAPIGVDESFNQGLIDYCRVYAKTLCMPLTSISVIVPKFIFEQEHGFKTDLKLGEDFDLWLRIAMKYPVAFLNKPLAYYNQDVELTNRAIGDKLYEPKEHMLFSDYGKLMQEPEFRLLYEKLALYGLRPYYISGKNMKEVKTILSSIDWKQHKKEYFFYYQILPRWIAALWFHFKKYGARIKKKIMARA